MNVITLTSQGLVIPTSQLTRMRMEKGDRLTVTIPRSGLLVLKKDAPAGEGRKKPGAAIAGDLDAFDVSEILTTMNNEKKTGLLSFFFDDASKSVWLRDGEVVFTSSSLEMDRLGPSLVRAGMISKQQLEEVTDLVKPGLRLGKLLIDREYITPKDLWQGVKEQVREILFSLFVYTEGEFLFISGELPERNTMTLGISSHALILMGIRQIEELSRLQQIIPDQEQRFEAVPYPPVLRLTDHEESILLLVDGTHTVREVIEESKLGEFNTLKALVHLLKAGIIAPMKNAEVEVAHSSEKPEEIIQRYNVLFSTLYGFVTERRQGFRENLKFYMRTPSSEYASIFKGLSTNEKGGFDEAQLLQNIQSLEADQQTAMLIKAMDSYLDFASFQARDILDDETYATLLQKMKEAQK